MSDYEDGFRKGFQQGWREGLEALNRIAQLEPMRYEHTRDNPAFVTSKTTQKRIEARKAMRKRKPSAYNRFMKKELKKLRKKHPRTKQTVLFKRAAKSWGRKR